MLEAAWWGFVGSSSLLIGALIALKFTVPRRALGLILAFGAGVLLSAVAYELFEEAVSTGTSGILIGGAFAVGATAFYLGDQAIERREGGSDQGLAIVLGAVLDGIPESLVIGISVASGEGLSVPVVVAVFLSNIPEAIASTTELRQSGRTSRELLTMWATVVAASTAASVVGFVVAEHTSAATVAAIQAFAAGAIIVMLADAMIPQAYADGGNEVGLATAFGFALSAMLSFRT
jgi:ZIP family zinc transporter